MSDIRGAESDIDVLVTREDVFAVFGNTLVGPDRLYYPPAPVDPNQIIQKFTNLRGFEPMATVLVDGSFDVPQPNHDWYLRHCRLLGGKLFLEKIGSEVTPDNLAKTMSQDVVSVAVTLDADEKIATKKGFNEEKGGIDRPIYPWRLRAERLAGLSFGLGGVLRHVVDLVTVEGDSNHHDTPLETTLDLAVFLTKHGLLDGLVIYGEHKQAIVDAYNSNVRTLVIPNKTNYAVDLSTGKPWSSSDFISRAQGKNFQD